MDTLGLILATVVHSASIQARDEAKLLSEMVQNRFPRLELIWGDGAYAGELIEWVKFTCGWLLEIVRRSSVSKGS